MNKQSQIIPIIKIQIHEMYKETVKVEETTSACDNLLLTWKTHGTPLGDRKVKETMHRTVSKILEEIEQWRENSSTNETLTSLTSIETFLEDVR